MYWVISLISVFLFVYLVRQHYKFFGQTSLKSFYLPALMLKLIAGVILGLIYFEYYNGGDTVHYDLYAKQMVELAYNSPGNYITSFFAPDTGEGQFLGETRSQLLINLISLFYLLTGSSYWITSLYFSFISFTTLWWIANLIADKFPGFRKNSAIAFLFVPSVVFWSSGITKESISITCIMLITSLALSHVFGIKLVRYWLLLLFPAVFVLWMLKYYILIVLLPALTIGILYFQLKTKPTLRIFLIVITPVVILWIGGLIHPNLNLEKIALVVYNNNQAYSEISKPDNLIVFQSLKPEIQSLIINFPKAVFYGVVSPFFDFNHNWLKAYVSAENLIILILLLFSLSNLQKLKTTNYSFLIVIAILFIVILAGFLAMSSPNLGTLSRYKVVFMPFLIFIVTIDNPLIKRIKFFNLNA